MRRMSRRVVVRRCPDHGGGNIGMAELFALAFSSFTLGAVVMSTLYVVWGK